MPPEKPAPKRKSPRSGTAPALEEEPVAEPAPRRRLLGRLRGGDAAPPGDGPGAAPPDRFRSFIAIAIGLISVAGAVATWRAANLGSAATDADRRAVLEAAAKEQSRSTTEMRVRSNETYFARARANREAADALESLADETGDLEEAGELRNEAQALRDVADNLENLTFVGYATQDDAGGETFDQERNRRDLLKSDAESFQANPRKTAAEADALRLRSERLVAWIAIFALCIVLLSVGQVLGGRYRAPLAGIGMAVFVAGATLALIGEIL
ncbi:MAG: hypothetical protein ACRDI1_00515 [Actinomycetota bacterium]